MNKLIVCIRREYEHWPHLALTLEEAARLWDAEERTCAAALHVLVRTKILTRREDGRFVRRDSGHQVRCPRYKAAA